MTARMEKVREALGTFATRDDRAAALAEVEEWEAERADFDTVLKDAVAHGRVRWEAAEAEGDRLKAALEQIVAYQFSGFEHYGNERTYEGGIRHMKDIARAALVPADPNTT